MAFSWAGNLSGSGAPKLVKNVQVSGNVYQGQLLQWDSGAGGTGGTVLVMADGASANPDATSHVAGICTAVRTSPTFDSTYKGDLCTYDVTQAAQVANEPIGAASVDMILITADTLIKAPIVKDTIGTNPERKACTTGSEDGLTFVVATIDTTVDDFSTAYCSKGANKGQYRIVTTGATATQTFTIAFPYDIAIGDEFCIVNVVPGFAHINFDTQFQGIDSSDALTYSYYVYVHELNLEEAGKEYAIFSFSPRHLL